MLKYPKLFNWIHNTINKIWLPIGGHIGIIRGLYRVYIKIIYKSYILVIIKKIFKK